MNFLVEYVFFPIGYCPSAVSLGSPEFFPPSRVTEPLPPLASIQSKEISSERVAVMKFRYQSATPGLDGRKNTYSTRGNTYSTRKFNIIDLNK